MQASDDTLVVQSVARLDVYDVAAGEAIWTQVLTLDDFPDWPQHIDLPEVLAVHGDWMVFGDASVEVAGHTNAGIAYLFHREEQGWTFSERLTASTPMPWAGFGTSADLDDRTLAIGEHRANDDVGAVHLYELRSGGWEEVQILEGDKPEWRFGSGVAVEGDWLLVGANHEWALELGYSYVHFFRRHSPEPGATWNLAQSFQGIWPWTSSFGREVELDGDYAVASDPGVLGGGGEDTIVYRRLDDDFWVQSQLITAPDKHPYNGSVPYGFGRAIHLRGRNLILASPSYGGVGGSTGMAYHYRLMDSHWDYLGALLPPQQERIEQLGYAVALAGGRAYAGARYKGASFGPIFHGMTVVGAGGATYAFDLSLDAQQFCSCPTASPCENVDSHGGCANSTGAGGVLASAGSGSLAADDLRLQAFDLPQYQVAVLAIGTQAVGMPFGDGRLCVWGNVLHAVPETTGMRGQVDWEPGVAGVAVALGAPIQPGELRHFQLFYRDPAGPCGTGINLTNAVRVDFKP